MAFTANNTIISNTQTNQETPVPASDQNQLNAQELALLLNILRKTSFLGEHIEITYNTVIKLQNQYLLQQPK
jgi:hypothetical protein